MTRGLLNGFYLNQLDGSSVETKVIEPGQEASDYLNVLLEGLCRTENNMVVGFGTEWDIRGSLGEYQIAMLKFCTQIGCVLVRLEQGSGSLPECVRKFLAFKDAMFVGVHIKNDIEMLRRVYNVVVGNAVELSEIAAVVVRRKPWLGAYGARELAGELISDRYLCHRRSPEVVMSNWSGVPLSMKQLEDPAADVFAAYRIGLFLSSHS